MQEIVVFRLGIGMRSTTQLAPTVYSERTFDDFYLAEYPQQVRRSYLMLNCADLAQDVVADAFAEVFRRWSDLQDPGPYLNKCVVNGCRKAGAKRTKQRSEALSVETPDKPTNFETAEFAELLMGLSHRQRASIVCRYYGRMTEQEIAEILGCQPGTVGSLIHRGLAQLRKELT